MDLSIIAPEPTLRPDDESAPEPIALPDERELLARLAALGELLDVSHCATAYQLARPQDLPDPWTDDLVSQRTLLRRLLRYTGEDDSSMPVALDDARELAVEGLGDQFRGELHYEGRTEGRICFSVTALGDLRAMLGPSCIEVARAVVHQATLAARPTGYRAAPEDAEADELPDQLDGFLASFLLGFGIPVTNACFDFRSAERVESGWARSTWRGASVGFPPDLASWLLAVVYRAGGREPAFVDEHRAQLNASQRQGFDRHWKSLEGEQERLRATLGWGSPDGWCEPGEPSLEPLDRDEQDVALTDAESERADSLRRPNQGRPVFRVRPRRTAALALAGGALGLFGGAMYGGGEILLLVLGAGLGGALGYHSRGSVCSDPECQTKLASGAQQCPGCGGTIAGDIDRADQRLEAYERLGLEQEQDD